MSNITPLSKFERLARSIFETALDKLLGDGGLVRAVVEQLIDETEKNLKSGRKANQYIVNIHPTDLESLQAIDPILSKRLAQYLSEAAEGADRKTHSGPTVLFQSDPLQLSGHVVVSSLWNSSDLQQTKAFRSQNQEQFKRELARLNAFLIVDGRRHQSLDRVKFSVGRHLENDIVLEDPAVSRKHAQIQWHSGRFIIYDLSSHSGTFVNGRRVTNSELVAGDVLTMGKVSLIYGEEPGLIVGSPELRISREEPTKSLNPTDPRQASVA